MRLENYIMEQDINTASVADIFVEQAQAELDVALALLNANVKDATFQEFYFVQEGELGTAVADARAEVRSDGKKHHLKAAVAAIRAFFKFFITKIGAFFKKNKTDGSAACSKMAVAMKQASAVAGTEMDILLPFTKEEFGKVYSFYDSLDKKLEKMANLSNQMVEWFLKEQNTFTDATQVKFEKEIEAFYNEVKNGVKLAESAAAPAKNSADWKREMKRQYKAAHKTEGYSDSDWMLDTDGNYVFVPKNSTSVYIGYEEYRKFVDCINQASKYWETEKKSIEENLSQINALKTDEPGGFVMVGGPTRPTRPKYDDSKSKEDNKKAVNDYKSAVKTYDTRNRQLNKNRILSHMSTLLTKLSSAIGWLVDGANMITSEVNKNKFKSVDRSKFSSNIGDGKRFANAHEAMEWKKAHPGESLKNVDDDIAGMPKAKSKYNNPDRKFENDKTRDEKIDDIIDTFHNFTKK